MLARVAEWTPSIFRKEGLLPQKTEVRDYLTYALKYDHNFPGTKYCICQLMHRDLESSDGQRLLASKTMNELWYVVSISSHIRKEAMISPLKICIPVS